MLDIEASTGVAGNVHLATCHPNHVSSQPRVTAPRVTPPRVTSRHVSSPPRVTARHVSQVSAEFWGFSGRSPDNRQNEPFMKW